jgi:nitrogen fixation/metabolism regulation signal transduction histidine kinase
VRGKAAGWALFLGCLLLLSFAATTPYSKTADLALISLSLAIVVVLSILVVRERWRHRDDQQQGDTRSRSDAGNTILQRFRRWYYDEQKYSR